MKLNIALANVNADQDLDCISLETVYWSLFLVRERIQLGCACSLISGL